MKNEYALKQQRSGAVVSVLGSQPKGLWIETTLRYSFHCSISLTRMDGGAYTQRKKYLSPTISLTRIDCKKNKNERETERERERERERDTKKNSKALILQCPVS